MTKLTQIQAARAGEGEPVREAKDIHGLGVLTAYAPVSPLGWLVFVELPAEEAYASLYDSIKRFGAIVLAGLVLAFLSGVFLAAAWWYRSRSCAPVRSVCTRMRSRMRP